MPINIKHTLLDPDFKLLHPYQRKPMPDVQPEIICPLCGEGISVRYYRGIRRSWYFLEPHLCGKKEK